MSSIISYSDTTSSIQPGDTKDVVISKIGQPKGQIKRGTTETLVYAGGDVILVDGKVTETSVPDTQPTPAKPSPTKSQTAQPTHVQQQSASSKPTPLVTNTKLFLDPATRRTAPFLLPPAAVPPLSLEDVNLQKFFAPWNAFDHVPYELSGFSHMTLPFHYECDGVQGTPEEAHAFSFLLSNALDWTPGCYCARHAYFVYKRTGADIIKAGRTFNPDLISQICERWQAAYAVGGILKRGKAGYSATIKLFDKDGKLVMDKTIPGPLDYFDLLGAVSSEVMRFFKYNPSPELIAHLSKKRCNDFQSVIDLGKAAFAEERSPAEFGLYESILKRDPDFAEVRYWYQNQKAWRDNTWDEYRVNEALSLQSYLTESALSDFNPKDCQDKALAAKYDSWIDQAEKILGPTHPLVVELKLISGRRSVELIDQALKTAQNYPNDAGLLQAILHVILDEKEQFMDCDLAASIAWASLNSNYLWGDPDAGTACMCEHIGTAVIKLGYHDVAAAAFLGATSVLQSRIGSEVNAKYYGRRAGNALRLAGRYEDSFNLYMASMEPSAIDECLDNAGIISSMLGQGGVYTSLKNQYCKEIAASPWLTGIYKTCDPYMSGNGKAVSLTNFPLVISLYGGDLERTKLQVQLMTNDAVWCSINRNTLTDALNMHPMDRELWILFDRYDRLDPKPESRFFYQSLEWLHSSDPWVVGAVRDFRKRAKEQPALNPDDVLAILKPFEPMRWPKLTENNRHVPSQRLLPYGMVAVAIHQLVLKHDMEKARELALRYIHYAFLCPINTDRLAYANHLYHMIDRPNPAGGVIPQCELQDQRSNAVSLLMQPEE
jgi:hypothetical protein